MYPLIVNVPDISVFPVTFAYDVTILLILIVENAALVELIVCVSNVLNANVFVFAFNVEQFNILLLMEYEIVEGL